MKIEVLSRDPSVLFRDSSQKIHKLPRNYSADQHPFQQEREYTRALNAAKLQKVFAAPFLGCLEGHNDTVQRVEPHPYSVSTFLSSSSSGEFIIWNLAQRRLICKVQAHRGSSTGLGISPNGEIIASCGADSILALYKLDLEATVADEAFPSLEVTRKLQSAPNSLDHLRASNSQEMVVCVGTSLELWSHLRADPLHRWEWGNSPMLHTRCSPVEKNLVGVATHSRALLLIDTRQPQPLRKMTLELRPNAISWNPQEAPRFVLACEDYNLYSWDMRKLSSAVFVHKGHTSAVLDVNFHNSGREFASASYDRTVRLWECNSSSSREVYHTQRMQRVSGVRYSLDGRFVISASDEMNLRLWKARADDKIAIMSQREKDSLNYNERLIKSYKNHPEIRKIIRHRHLPKHVYNAKKELKIINDALKRKEENRRKHSQQNTYPHIAEQVKHVIGEDE